MLRSSRSERCREATEPRCHYLIDMRMLGFPRIKPGVTASLLSARCRDPLREYVPNRMQHTTYGSTTVIRTGSALPMPRSAGRYMSSTSGGGTV